MSDPEHVHLWLPVREGRLSNGEPRFVHRCECGKYLRNGAVSDN